MCIRDSIEGGVTSVEDHPEEPVKEGLVHPGEGGMSDDIDAVSYTHLTLPTSDLV